MSTLELLWKQDAVDANEAGQIIVTRVLTCTRINMILPTCIVYVDKIMANSSLLLSIETQKNVVRWLLLLLWCGTLM